MSNVLEQNIMYLPGVGPKRAEILKKELQISIYKDLLYYFPYKYIDRTRFYKIAELTNHMPYVQIKGKITRFETVGERRKQRLVAHFSDDSGQMELVWFQGIKWVRENLNRNTLYIVFGKPTSFGKQINIVHPELEPAEATRSNSGIFQAFYNTTETCKKKFITSKAINKLQWTLANLLQDKISETLPEYFVRKLKIMPLQTALKQIHFPENPSLLKAALFRLKFEELFFIQLKILSLKHKRKNHFKGFLFSNVGYNLNTFYKNHLPFELTNAQKRVIKEIRKDTNTGKQMNRLVQGDVGSGKTLVALMTALIALDNGYQTCLMAPTEILANQHFNTISKMTNGLGIELALLTGSTKTKERNIIHQKLESGEMQLLIGTHALIENTVKFQKLGLVIIDEQHRFGVAQRAKLWKKNALIPPHILVMTATPIPRTLAMTVYGDLDVSVIDELPPGRKPIQTIHFYENRKKQLYEFIREQVNRGRQIYIVYPLISESEKLDLKNLEDGYELMKEIFPRYKISMVHGRMKAADKDAEMQLFKNGETQIMMATTVIEVGVDVPNASVMIIENAERFGLSQLHQLRGRVGRGAEQSFCVLVSSFKLTKESRKRIDTMVRTNDGFEIAEVDMKLRGPGDIEGTQQSGVGFNLKISNLGKDGEILQHARNIAIDLLNQDPLLQKQENQLLKQQLLSMKNTDFEWSNIS